MGVVMNHAFSEPKRLRQLLRPAPVAGRVSRVSEIPGPWQPPKRRDG